MKKIFIEVHIRVDENEIIRRLIDVSLIRTITEVPKYKTVSIELTTDKPREGLVVLDSYDAIKYALTCQCAWQGDDADIDENNSFVKVADTNDYYENKAKELEEE